MFATTHNARSASHFPIEKVLFRKIEAGTSSGKARLVLGLSSDVKSKISLHVRLRESRVGRFRPEFAIQRRPALARNPSFDPHRLFSGIGGLIAA